MLTAIPKLKRQHGYTTFTVPKRNGKFRTITAPCEALKAKQTILMEFLETRERGDYYGFTSGEGVASACRDASEFVASIANTPEFHDYSVFTADFKDAFGSVKFKQVRKLLYSLDLPRRAVRYWCNIALLNGSLPQGSPASPILLNMTLADFDARMQEFALQFDGFYARYADDLVLVVKTRDKGFISRHILSILKENASWMKFEPSKTSCKRLDNRSGFELFGVRISRRKSQPRKATRRKLRAAAMLLRGAVPSSDKSRLTYKRWKNRKALLESGQPSDIQNLRMSICKGYICYAKPLTQKWFVKVRTHSPPWLLYLTSKVPFVA